ncbi:hypothetical protein Pelo_6158 [Pelomyxa schiedti]|nr:hypothetical protein Pelo_6158 [Pelomyxa schiedti]
MSGSSGEAPPQNSATPSRHSHHHGSNPKHPTSAATGGTTPMPREAPPTTSPRAHPHHSSHPSQMASASVPSPKPPKHSSAATTTTTTTTTTSTYGDNDPVVSKHRGSSKDDTGLGGGGGLSAPVVTRPRSRSSSSISIVQQQPPQQQTPDAAAAATRTSRSRNDPDGGGSGSGSGRVTPAQVEPHSRRASSYVGAAQPYPPPAQKPPPPSGSGSGSSSTPYPAPPSAPATQSTPSQKVGAQYPPPPASSQPATASKAASGAYPAPPEPKPGSAAANAPGRSSAQYPTPLVVAAREPAQSTPTQSDHALSRSESDCTITSRLSMSVSTPSSLHDGGGSASDGRKLFGSPLDRAVQQLVQPGNPNQYPPPPPQTKLLPVPYIVTQCANFLTACAKTADGVFVLAVSKDRVKEFRELFETAFVEGRDVTFPPNTDYHVVGGLLKLYLFTLPVPLLSMGPDGLNPFYKAAESEDNSTCHVMIIKYLETFPPAAKSLLQVIIPLIRTLITNCPQNRPRVSQLTHVFATVLGNPKTPEATTQVRKVVGILLRHGLHLQVSPAEDKKDTKADPKSAIPTKQPSDLSREELLERLFKAESKIQELQCQMKDLESENTRLKQDLQSKESDAQEMLGYIRTLQNQTSKESSDGTHSTASQPADLSTHAASKPSKEELPPKSSLAPEKGESGPRKRSLSFSALPLSRTKSTSSIDTRSASSSVSMPTSELPTLPTLHINIIGAHNLPAVDTNGFSDPYVILKVSDWQYKSKTIKKSLNPVWNEVTSLFNAHPQDVLLVEVWDWNAIESSTFLGVVEIPLVTLIDGKPRECRYVLESNSSKKAAGDIHLILQLIPYGVNPDLHPGSISNLRPLVHIGNGQLRLEVLEAAELKSNRDVYCVGRVGAQEAQSQLNDSDNPPAWKTTFYFEVTDATKASLEIWKWNKVKSKRALGQISITIRELVPDTVKEQWTELAPMKAGKKAKGAVHFTSLYIPEANIPPSQISFGEFFKADTENWSTSRQQREKWIEDVKPVVPPVFDLVCQTQGNSPLFY